MLISSVKRQLLLILLVVVIASWLAAFPSLLRFSSTAQLNKSVPLATNRELAAVVNIGYAKKHDCMLIFEPAGSVIDEVKLLYEIYISKTLQPISGGLRLEVECSAYKVDEPGTIHTTISSGFQDLFDQPLINITRVRPAMLFGFKLTPGVYVVRAKLNGDISKLAAANLSARIDLIASDTPGLSWHEKPWLPLAIVIFINTYLPLVLAALCAVITFRLVVDIFNGLRLKILKK